jgi:hypothetical protein
MRIKGPPATFPCCRVAFYWRRGEVLQEKEYITDEFRQALTAHQSAKADLAQVEAQIRSAT